jgi:hypothetical protein
MELWVPGRRPFLGSTSFRGKAQAQKASSCLKLHGEPGGSKNFFKKGLKIKFEKEVAIWKISKNGYF